MPAPLASSQPSAPANEQTREGRQIIASRPSGDASSSSIPRPEVLLEQEGGEREEVALSPLSLHTQKEGEEKEAVSLSGVRVAGFQEHKPNHRQREQQEQQLDEEMGLSPVSDLSQENAEREETSLSSSRVEGSQRPQQSVQEETSQTNQSKREVGRFQHAASSLSSLFEGSLTPGQNKEEPEDEVVLTAPERFGKMLEACTSLTAISTFHGACHLNPFALALLFIRCSAVGGRAENRLSQPQCAGQDATCRRKVKGLGLIRWCGRTKVAGYRVPWVLWNSTYSLLIVAAIYDSIFSSAVVICAIVLGVINSSSSSLCTNEQFIAWIETARNISSVADIQTAIDALLVMSNAVPQGDRPDVSPELLDSLNGTGEMLKATNEVIDDTLYASLYGNEDSIGICTLLTLDNVFLGLFACLYALVTVQGWFAMVKAVVYVRHARTFAPIALQVHVEYNGKQVPVKEALKHVAATVGLHQRGARAAMTPRLPHGGALGLIAAATRRGVVPCGNVTASEPETSEPGRFVVTKLVTGRPVDAALGISCYMAVVEEEVFAGLAVPLAAMQREFQVNGTPDDRFCLDYVLNGRTGSSERQWVNGVLDEGRPTGLTLADFAAHPEAQLARLSLAHVAALRFYTTAGFRSLNTPLRENPNISTARDAYPFPVTMSLITEGIKRLRAVGASSNRSRAPVDLWRGMRNVRAGFDFETLGGTEVAPMSTTRDLAVAVRYSVGQSSGSDTATALLLKLNTTTFLDRGADLTFLSCFPGESEVCYPPLTYLQPTGRRETLVIDTAEFVVIEVQPRLS